MKENGRKDRSSAGNAKKLRKRAEESLRRRVGEVEPEKLSVEEARRLVHELQVHQIELEMQNEELRLSQIMLEEARQKYSDLYDFAPSGYFTFDRDGIILEANLTGALLLGEPRGRLIRKPFAVYIHHDSQDEFYLHRRRLFESLDKHVCELKLNKKDGTEFSAQLESMPISESRFRSSLSDITARKMAEEALKESEEKHRVIFEQARDGIVLMDYESGVIVDCNAEYERQTGRKLAELRKLKIWELRPPEQVEIAKRKFFELQKKGEVASSDLVYLRPDGGVTPIDFVSKVVTMGGKKYMQGITRDITERKKTEEALAESEKEYRNLVDNSITGIFKTKLDGEFLYVNEAGAKIFGFDSSKEMMSKGVLARYANSADRDALIRALKRDGRLKNYELKLLNRKGDVVNVLLNAILENVTISGMVLDITERKRTEEELKKYRQRLEQMVEERTLELVRVNLRLQEEIANREKMEEEIAKAQKLESVGVLAGGIAHDFNNALSAIMNSIFAAKMFLSDGAKNEKALSTLEAALKAVRRATAMSYQLLTFAEGGEPVRKTAYIKNLIKDTVEFSLRGSNVSCDFHVADDLWPVYVDEGQIAQVVSNLVINAHQSMPKGGKMEVSAENVRVKKTDALPLEAGRYAKLTVKDSGMGIPREDIQKIFDPYFTTKEKGSGLGLATSYSIVKKHGGLVTVESEMGKGSAFYVYLPVSDEKIIDNIPEAEEGRKGGKILVMDDESEVRDSMAMLLKIYGYEADFAKEGAEAVESYKMAMESGKSFDAVVLDLTVSGGMGGVEALNEIKQMDPRVKAIVASGYSNDPVMADYKNYGFIGAVSKPYEVAELNKLLQRAIYDKSR